MRKLCHSIRSIIIDVDLRPSDAPMFFFLISANAEPMAVEGYPAAVHTSWSFLCSVAPPEATTRGERGWDRARKQSRTHSRFLSPLACPRGGDVWLFLAGVSDGPGSGRLTCPACRAQKLWTQALMFRESCWLVRPCLRFFCLFVRLRLQGSSVSHALRQLDECAAFVHTDCVIVECCLLHSC